MKNGNEKKVREATAVTAAGDTSMGYMGGVRPSVEHTASDGASGAVGFLDRLRRVGAGARALIHEVCTFELLGLCTMLLPALMAGVGFFFGQTVTPLYFYVSVAVLLVCAFVGGWKRGVAYVALLAVCTVLTMFTFSYTNVDASSYHFPMQHLLRNGWNPVFDSTVEKFYPLLEGMRLWLYHTLFLPKFHQLCGAIVSSAFRLFVGDAFLDYVLIACLFATSLKFARRYWNVGAWMGIPFAFCMTFSTKVTYVLVGFVDYSSYASFLMAALSLVLYRNNRKLSDLVLFVVAACICMTTKTTGILCVGLLVVLTLPLLWKRTAYWHALMALGLLVAVVGASPLLTNWIQYGSPFYPSMTFNPHVQVVDITNDFTGNADAMSMGYLSRICYVWGSPKLTVAAIRLLGGNPSFNPVFSVGGGVAGLGLWFNILLLISVVLLVVSRKNLVTWLCVIIFVSSNFAPVKYIGYERYFPQIWAILPLAVMNYVCATRHALSWTRLKPVHKIASVVVLVSLVGLAGMHLSRFVRFFAGAMVREGVRQRLISSLPKSVKVDDLYFRYTTVQRFRQAGITMVKATDGETDTTVMEMNVDRLDDCLEALPRWDPVTSRVALTPKDESWHRREMQSSLTCTDPQTGDRFSFYSNLSFARPGEDCVKALYTSKGRLRTLIDNFPHVLWDNGQGGAK